MSNNSTILLESDTNEMEIVEFQIDEVDDHGQRVPCYYGVNVAKVREIIRLPQMWKVPNSQPSVAGMIKLREKVITLINLATVLNKDVGELEPERVIVLEFNRLSVGILVHSVSRIYRISWKSVEPPARSVHAEYVTSMVKMDDRIILLLDFEKIVGELCPEYSVNANSIDHLTESIIDRSSFKILVADDSPFIRNTLCASLRNAGYCVEEAENGEEAWQMIENKINTYGSEPATLRKELGLVITDVEMPKMDGLHLTSRIRKEDILKEMPVIIFSSLASEDNIRKWRNIGANDILTKPDLPNLVKVTDEYIRTYIN